MAGICSAITALFPSFLEAGVCLRRVFLCTPRARKANSSVTELNSKENVDLRVAGVSAEVDDSELLTRCHGEESLTRRSNRLPFYGKRE
jgi:hypothetical protein